MSDFISPLALNKIADVLMGTRDSLEAVLHDFQIELDDYQKQLIPIARCRQCHYWVPPSDWSHGCQVCGFISSVASNVPDPDWEEKNG